MKFRSFLVVMVALAMVVAGCSGQAAPTGVTAATQLQQVQTALAEVKAATVAATQPIVITPAVPATETQPYVAAVTVDPLAQVVKSAGKLQKVIDKAQLYVATAATVASAAATPGADLGTTITQSAPLFGPYAGYAALAGLAITAATAAWGMIQKNKAATSNAALTSTVAGVRDALNSGDLTATPTAAAVVDAAVISHPATDELVDAVHAAAMPPAAT